MVVVVEEEAAIVRYIFEQYASGHGLKTIANQLNHRGHRTKTGKPFSTTAIRDLLDNPMFIGKIRYNRYENWAERRRKGISNEPILVDGNHPPIITEELWDKVKLLRKRRGHCPRNALKENICLPDSYAVPNAAQQ